MTIPAIEAQGVTKRFRLHEARTRSTTLKSTLVDFVRRRRHLYHEQFMALQDINITVEAGRSLGIIGQNGSGKSTLLRVIAGIYRADAGTVHVHGRVVPLIELGAGFHPEFTGRENIVVNGMLLGLSRAEISARVNDIVAFADLQEFIDEPARTYSSGMYMRLGFSVAVHVDPDVLLIDEVLAVGDQGFARKCSDRIAEFRRTGKTLLLVTHDPVAVERWCDEVLWLDHGMIQAIGPPRKVLDLYREAMARRESERLGGQHHGERVATGSGGRWGTREIEIVDVRVEDAGRQERHVFESEESMVVIIRYVVRVPVKEPVFGFGIVRRDGLSIYGTNTLIDDNPLPPLGQSGEVRIKLDRLDLVAGGYFFDVAVHDRDGYPFDYHSSMYPFSITSGVADVGVYRTPHTWDIRPLPE